MTLATIALLALSAGPAGFERFQTVSQGVKLDVIKADLKRTDLAVRIVLADGFPDGDEAFDSMVKKTPGIVAAINGAYFDKYTLKPIGDIWTGGQLVRKGLMGTAFCIRDDNTMDIRRVERHRGVDWSEFSSVLACGPALVLDGKVDCDWEAEGFRDPHVTGSTTRMGLGYTAANELLLVRCNSRVTFSEFAKAMRGLGCHEAMNLDSGASRGFFFDGTFIEKPGRLLTNVLAITRSKSR